MVPGTHDGGGDELRDPANPRCADLLTHNYWGGSDFYGIGGKPTVS
jgi:hypothetical protein